MSVDRGLNRVLQMLSRSANRVAFSLPPLVSRLTATDYSVLIYTHTWIIPFTYNTHPHPFAIEQCVRASKYFNTAAIVFVTVTFGSVLVNYYLTEHIFPYINNTNMIIIYKIRQKMYAQI